MSQFRLEQEESAQGQVLYRSPDEGISMDAEEGAQGHDLYRAPGQGQFAAEAHEDASDWVSGEMMKFPAAATRDGIVSRRQELYDAMRRLESATARPSGLADWRIEIEAALADLEAGLRDHVAQVEGEGGLFDEILEQAPHLESDILSMRREHDELLSRCHQALSMSADWESAALRRRVNVLLARVALHRQYGAELLFDAYNVDLAVGN